MGKDKNPEKQRLLQHMADPSGEPDVDRVAYGATVDEVTHVGVTPMTEDEEIQQHRALFGSMLKMGDHRNQIEKYIIPANANRDEDIINIVNGGVAGRTVAKKLGRILSFCVRAPLIFPLAVKIKVVEPQEFYLTSNSGRPEILTQGTHFLASFRHDYERSVPKTETYIQFRGMSIIQIANGFIGRAWRGNEPIFLGPGRHCYCDPRLKYDKKADIALNCGRIIHGTKQIITVTKGMLAYGLHAQTSQPVVMAEGIHVINDPAFKFVSMIDLNRAANDIGQMRLIRVETGYAGVAYRNGGHLAILPAGIHLICPPDRFHGLISTMQSVLELPETIQESGDYVPLRVKADVFYKIVDPFKAISTIGDIQKSIRETAIATLAGIIRSSTLADIAQSSKPTFAKSAEIEEYDGMDASAGAPPATAPSFYTHIHDDFLSQLGEHVRRDWGVEIENIRIESLKIDDQSLAKEISDQAMLYAKTQAQLSNLEADRRIKTTQADSDARVRQLSAQARKQAAALDAEAAAFSKREAARAEAEALRMIAEAEADAVRTRAAAEKDRLELEGDGNKAYVEKMEQTATGGKLVMLREQAKVFKNTEKVFFTGEMPAFFNSAFGEGQKIAAAATLKK